MMIFLGMLLSYLIGSIPIGYLFVKFFKGMDIREHGSGNVGATNVYRVVGKGPGIIVLVLDIIKGVIAVTLLADILGLTELTQRIVLSVFVIGGHNWTCFLNFKGGKGVATTLGVLIGFTLVVPSIRIVLLTTVAVFFIVFLLTRFVSLSSILASIALPILMVVTAQPIELVIISVLFCVFVVLRHKANIKRLLAGEEPKVPLSFGRKKYL